MANWIIPCNPKFYDVFGAFRELQTIDWRQYLSKVEIGDTVFIYTGRPIMAITHKCRVVEVNTPCEYVDDGDIRFNLVQDNEWDSLRPGEKYMRLELIKEYDSSALSYSKLIEYGLLGSIQGQQRVRPEIQAAIDSVEEEAN